MLSKLDLHGQGSKSDDVEGLVSMQDVSVGERLSRVVRLHETINGAPVELPPLLRSGGEVPADQAIRFVENVLDWDHKSASALFSEDHRDYERVLSDVEMLTATLAAESPIIALRGDTVLAKELTDELMSAVRAVEDGPTGK